jgi:glucose/arabinose dehydrogenase
MRRDILTILIGIAVLAAGAGGIYLWQNFRGAGPAFLPQDEEIRKNIETEIGALTLAKGFTIEVFAKDLPGARVMVRDSFGNFWISQPSEGKITTLEIGDDGKVVRQGAVFTGLRKPHGLALDPERGLMLYIAEEHRISNVALYSEDSLHKIADMPSGGRHTTRTIAFAPDGKLYVSIGSSCDVCEESNRAAIFRMNPDGSEYELFAGGLRNAVFFDWDPVDGRMWATEMGRDHLGDDLPPDEINIVENGYFYGWPWFYGKENVRDEKFEPTIMPALAFPLRGAQVEIPAHSAPLGLAFVPEGGWPEEMALDLLVAYHGSWNSSVPTGYKIVRVELDQRTREPGEIKDFITGWLPPAGGQVIGRPVDLMIEPGGTLYISDDKAGVIYRLRRIGLE